MSFKRALLAAVPVLGASPLRASPRPTFHLQLPVCVSVSLSLSEVTWELFRGRPQVHLCGQEAQCYLPFLVGTSMLCVQVCTHVLVLSSGAAELASVPWVLWQCSCERGASGVCGAVLVGSASHPQSVLILSVG